jgi:hypothetical protein
VIAALALAGYLLIGLLYANHEYNDILASFEEEIDEIDPDEQQYLESRNNLYDQMHNLHKILGDKGLKMLVLLFLTLFWLPVIIYTKMMPSNK